MFVTNPQRPLYAQLDGVFEHFQLMLWFYNSIVLWLSISISHL